MKRAFLLLVVACCINSCHLLKPAKQPVELKVMTFNIRYGTANDGENRWELRKSLLLDCLRKYKPDILSTQESLPMQIKDIQDQFPDWRVFGKGRYFNKPMPSRPQESMDGESCRIFYDKNKFELLQEGTFWHSDTPDVPASATWGNELPRIVTWGIFRTRQTGKTFVMMNTHFHWGELYVTRTSELIMKKWRELAGDKPTLFTGDFNLPPTSPTHALFCGKMATGHDLSLRYFYDAYESLNMPQTDMGTGHSFKGVLNQDRIDWILYTREFTPAQVTIIHDQVNGRYPSDHYPVLAVFKF
jgi:endonuclease/exonuclease/phosphatase family metal-dependent hydrolase